uniref:Uncharacterized protein n=1 Tax=Panagrolaimus sp. ES5 TaxID=591445 RepID=A0AC34FZD0_9BILA
MVKQLVFAYGVIEKTVYGSVKSEEAEKLVQIIEDKLDKADRDRGNKYWNSKYMDGLINHCMVMLPTNIDARNDLYRTMVERYGNTGYYFAVGVYNAVTGPGKHCIEGDHFILLGRNGRNAYVLRNRKASSYSNSKYLTEAKATWKPNLTPIPTQLPDLRVLMKELMQKDGHPAAAVMVRDNNGLAEEFNRTGFDAFYNRGSLMVVVAKMPR